MDAKRLDEVEELFHLARQRAPEERGAFLDGACRDDLPLRTEVESLLAHGSREPGARPVLESNSRVERRGPLQEGPGTVIGPYKLLQAVGEGGFGVVYMAEQRQPVRRRVALKVIKLGMDTKQVIARFEAERQALALMDHPNIAKVLDAGATETGRPYFVMELVRGVPITEYCDKAEMGTDDRLRLFVLVCRAVQHAHQKGIVHRDIKPSNILVTLHDGEPVPKVIDFGIAKATNQELTEKTVFTEFRQFIGTPEYMSPEQAEMSGLDIDTRADVYSLGVLLYELLTGTTPVDPARLRSAGYEEIQRILCDEEPVRPSTRLSTLKDAALVARQRRDDAAGLVRSLRGDLDCVVLKALEKDRSRRYETASAFALDVERHLNHEPVLASPPGRLYKLGKFVRRNRGPVLAAAAVLVALLLGIAGTTTGFLRARDAFQREQAARNRAEANARLAHAEAEGQRALAEFFQTSLLSASSWRFEGAAPARVVDLLDLAAERLAAGEMADQPANRAVLAYAVAIAYLDRDRWEQSLEHLRLAVEWLGDGSADPLTFSRAARELNRIDSEPYFQFDVGVDVEALRERALRVLEPAIDAGGPAVVSELWEWAHVMFLRARYTEAAQLLRTNLPLVQALDSQDAGAGLTPPDPTVVEFNLACAEARLGNADEARRRYAAATRGLRGILERGDAAAAARWVTECQHPAITLLMETDPPLREVVELARSRYPARNLALADLLWSAAWVYDDIGFAAESFALMREAVEIARGFPDNRLMLGSALVDLAYFEWRRGLSDQVLERCLEARPMLEATRARTYRRANRLIVGCLVERLVADPRRPDAAELVRQVESLADEASEGLASDESVSTRLAWWSICGDRARLHRAMAAAGIEKHDALAREWTDRLRSDLTPFLEAPLPANVDGPRTDLALAVLLLEDATPAELALARDLARRADELTGGRLTRPVDDPRDGALPARGPGGRGARGTSRARAVANDRARSRLGRPRRALRGGAPRLAGEVGADLACIAPRNARARRVSWTS